MTEDFEKSESVEPEAELLSPFDEPGATLSEEVEAVVVEEPIAPPPLPEVVSEEVVAEVEAIAPPPLPEAYTETEVLGAIPLVPEPEPAAPTSRPPITLGPPSTVSAPLPRPVDVSPAEEATPKKSNQTLIIVLIVVAVLLFLCCCCVLPIGLILANLDEIMWQLGMNLFALI
jgi:hypothetical protein